MEHIGRRNIQKNTNILNRMVDSRLILLFFPLLTIIGKVVRWTIMRGTLINLSKGWGYVDVIVNQTVTFHFFEMEDVLEGSSGSDAALMLFYKFIRKLCFDIPDDFYSFEIVTTLILGAMLFVLCTKIKPYVTVMEFVFLTLAIMVLNVYCFSLAKESLQMMYFYLLFLVIYTKKVNDRYKLFFGSLVIFFSAATYRTYYVLILVFTFAFVFFMRFVKFKSDTILYLTVKVTGLFLKMVGVYFAIMCTLLVMLDSLYERLATSLLFASDATSSANTYIENVITNSTANVFLVVIEYGVMVLRLLFPFELISLGVKYWPYIIYQLCMSVMMIRTTATYHRNSRIQNVALAFFVGFVFASATFEVDYGAWIRHGVVTLPLILLMSGTIEKKRIQTI
ncbi:MAG: hypothetical protein R3Y24_06945 [Eubacteriales bacterium]